MSIWNHSGTGKSWKEQLDEAYARAEERRKAGKLPPISTTPKTHSSFWLDDDLYESVAVERRDPLAKHSPEYSMKLSSIRRGIANFVRIVTGRDIPVHFSSGEQSFAVGREKKEFIVISATDDPAQFDVNVGTALHEAAHLILSKINTGVKESVPLFEFLEQFKKHPDMFFVPAFVKDQERLNLTDEQATSLVTDVLNVMEDRRIDKWMYQRAVGYRGYYDAMYRELWHSKEIDKLLANPLARRPLVKVYRMRVVNMTNQYASPDALPGLKAIYDLIDLDHIERFAVDARWKTWKDQKHRDKSTGSQSYPIPVLPDMIQVALEVAGIILKNSVVPDKIDNAQFNVPSPGESDKSAGITSGPSDEDDEKDTPDDNEETNWDVPDNLESPTEGSPEVDDSEDDEEETEEETKSGTPNEEELEGDTCDIPEEDLTIDQQAEKFDNSLDEEMEAQSKFLDGDTEKELLEEDIKAQLDALEGAGAEMKLVGDEFVGHAKVIVYHKLTEQLVHSPNFLFTTTSGGVALKDVDLLRVVDEGISMGNVLAHRLRVMADESTLHYTRQNAGKIDKRLLAGLGYENENVFYHNVTERYNPVLLHLTVDSSSSMGQHGAAKWYRAVKLAVALAKAAEKVANLEVVISFRASSNEDYLANILIAYDSRVDSFAKVKRFFPYLRAEGGTPEGLCFQAIKDEIIKTGKAGVRKFFVNISDGDPQFNFHIPMMGDDGEIKYETGDYSEDPAWKHTSRQVQEIRESGISVLSYFVQDKGISSRYFYDDSRRFRSWVEKCHFAFKAMYGKDARFINTDAVPEIARTLNDLFLEK